jgi:hypothetical protein
MTARTVYSFAFFYTKARGVPLLAREVCSCGCGRTFTRDDRVCISKDQRVYATPQCLYEHVALKGTQG